MFKTSIFANFFFVFTYDLLIAVSYAYAWLIN